MVSGINNYTRQSPVFTESGIYFLREKACVILDPAIIKPIDPGNVIFSVRYKFKIDGTEANYQIENKRPEFYFVFDTVKKSLNDPDTKTLIQDNYFYIDPLYHNGEAGYSNRIYQAISPNDFRLLKLELDKAIAKENLPQKNYTPQISMM